MCLREREREREVIQQIKPVIPRQSHVELPCKFQTEHQVLMQMNPLVTMSWETTIKCKHHQTCDSTLITLGSYTTLLPTSKCKTK